MKKLVVTLLISSFAFSGISFNKYISYGDYAGNSNYVGNGFGVDFDINDSMSFGYDTNYGMMVKANNFFAKNITLRFGIKEINQSTEASDGDDVASSAGSATWALTGVSYDWWTGGKIIKTTMGASIDYRISDNDNDIAISINIGWGF